MYGRIWIYFWGNLPPYIGRNKEPINKKNFKKKNNIFFFLDKHHLKKFLFCFVFFT
jgi:hypothetical protein